MVELLSPGVFIEEIPSSLNVITPVSTSNMGIVGFTSRGPVDEATLVTSFDQYTKIFGPLVKESLVGLSVAAFYSNGGRRCFVVRTVPSDAIKADLQIQSLTTDQQIETGDGSTGPAGTPFVRTAATSPLKDNDGAAPLVPGSLTLKYRGLGTAVVSQVARIRSLAASLVSLDGRAAYDGAIDPKASLIVPGATADGHILYRSLINANTAISITHVDPGAASALIIAVVGNAISVTLAHDGVAVTSTGQDVVNAINADAAASLLVTAEITGTGLGLTQAFATANLAGGLPAFDGALDSVLAGTFSLTWTASGIARTVAFAAGDLTTPIATKVNGNGSEVTIDLRSGKFSLLCAAVETPILADVGTYMLASYRPTTETYTLTTGTTVDASGRVDLLGTPLVAGGGIANGSFVNIATGAYMITTQAGVANIPHNTARMLATYTTNAWRVAPISQGDWANTVKVQLVGSPDGFTASTAQYSSFNMNVLMLNTSTGNYDTVESFEDLVFNDATSGMYFPDVINELSDLVRVTDPGGLEAPGQLQGIPRSMTLAGGDGLSSGKTVTTNLLGSPVAQRSVTISYTDTTGVVRTITDDGKGHLVGSIDPTGNNTIVYSSGAVDFKTLYPIRGGTLVVADYFSSPAESSHTERFGDTTKAYSYSITLPDPLPTVYFYRVGTNGTFTSTTYGRSQISDYATLSPDYRGLYALSRVEELLQVIIPDFAGDVTITLDILDYADSRANLPHGGDRFVILTSPKGQSAQEVVDWFKFELQRYSDFAALYWPWVRVADPLANGRPLTMPALGHIAGIYARTDNTKNVSKAPAGTVDGALKFLIGLEMNPSQGERDYVYPNKINPLISSPQTGLAVWGCRTISNRSEWRYVSSRRLFMFLERSIFNATHWIVFENNGPNLWSRIKAQLNGFLLALYSENYFAGNTPAQAFFVTVDDSNNIPETIELGEVIIDVGVATQKPAEFVRFRMQQKSLTA